ncbi:heavy metal translocating P-type ATPase [Methylocella sp.]|uniref:heavy metal translocating P-type ATPase n=1 Tax=Methylocella sp. TaxID=1978226 RepID=UPI003782D73B
MTEALDLSAFVQPLDEGASRIEFAVEGVDDLAAMRAIETALEGLAGVSRARVNVTQKRLLVEWAGALDPALIAGRLAQRGFRAYPFARRTREEDVEAAQERWLLRCLAVAAFAAMNIMLLSVSVWAGNVSDITPEARDLFHWISALIVLPACAFAGQPFFRSALAALRKRQLNMDVPISLGVLLALAMSVAETALHSRHAYFDSAIMLLVFLLAGRYLDQTMRRRTRSYAANLSAIRAPTAERVEPDGGLRSVPAAALRPGDLVQVKPGARVPVDGVVIEGRSEVDLSLVTGESAPVAAGPGLAVYAGALNYAGALRVRASAGGGSALIDEIERLLDAAVTSKSAYVRLADRAARLYAPVVHATALLTVALWLALGASWHFALVTAISVLIITCPCALALAVPAVQIVASGALLRARIVLSAGDAIERFAEVDTVVFDKTGTLTQPEFSVEADEGTPPRLAAFAARLALASHHPLAGALARISPEAAPFPGVEERPGEGVLALVDGREARLGSPAFCGLEALAAEASARDPFASIIAFRWGDDRAAFRIRQELRPDARMVCDELRRRGLRLVIASGDRAAAVRACAEALGVTDWRAGLRPGEKLALLDELRAQGRKTLMAGDGMNDAPSLAAAHASISPIAGSGLAQAAADAVFLGDRLEPVLSALDISRQARRLMRQNLFFAVAYNMVAVPLAVAGHATPLVAAAAMSCSSIVVTLNALRGRGPGEAARPNPSTAARPGRLNEAAP